MGVLLSWGFLIDCRGFILGFIFGLFFFGLGYWYSVTCKKWVFFSVGGLG